MDKILELKVDSTIFLIEHNMDVVFNYSDEIFVMARGKIIAQGTPNEIETNREVIEAYLGEEEEEAGPAMVETYLGKDREDA